MLIPTNGIKRRCWIGAWAKLKEFEYEAAGSIDEAVSLLAARGDSAKVLAGGTDLIAQMRAGQRSPSLVVDIKKIPELLEMKFSPDTGLELGAAVPCYQIYGSPEICAAYPGLVDSARIIGGWQIQSRASVGGNLCNGSPAADSVPPLMAYDVQCELAGPSGRRMVPAAEFCVGPGKTVLGRGELLTKLIFPAPAKHSGAAYQRFIPRNEMDIAAAGAGSFVQLDPSGKTIVSACIALAAVGPKPVLAEEAMEYLAGKPAENETFAEAGEKAKSVATPITDMRGTAEYRMHLVGVLVKRTLAIAVRRAREIDAAMLA